MPIRFSTSSVLVWPDGDAVHLAAREWAEELARARPEVRSVHYIGSYARGDWGVGSDLDLVVILDEHTRPFHERASDFDTTTLPVPADLLVYTAGEWDGLTGGIRGRVEEEGVRLVSSTPRS